MELSELMKLSDKEKLEYVRNNAAKLDQNAKLDILKSIRNNNLKIASITDNDINLNLISKVKYLGWLAEGNIPVNYYYDVLEATYNQCLKESNDKEKLEYIKSDINDTFALKVEVIQTLEDEQLKIDYLENVNISDIELSSFDKKNIIKSLRSDQLKVYYLEKLDLELDFYDKSEIISAFLSEQLKIKYLRKFTSEFSSYENAKVIASLKDDQLKIKYLEKKDGFNDIAFRASEKANIISSLKDDELKLKYLRSDKDLLCGESYDKGKIIASLKGDQLKIECLKNSGFELKSEDMAKIVKSLTEEQLKVKCLESPDIGLELLEKAEVVKSLDEQVKIACLGNPNIGLKSSDKAKIIRILSEDQLSIECISNPNIALEISDKAKVITSLNSDEIKLSYIEDLNIGFSEQDKLLIICSLQDEGKFERFGVLADDSYKKGLNLPSNMTIGVELEAEGINADGIYFIGEVLSEWKAKGDDTLKDGVEIVSPILHDTEEDMYSLAIACNIMQKLDLNTSERCGRTYTFWC